MERFQSRRTSTSKATKTSPAEPAAHEFALAEAGLQLSWTTAPDGNVVQDIPLWRSYTGQSLEEVQGLNWLNALHPHERAETERRWSQTVASGARFESEFRLRASAGNYTCFLAYAIAVRAEDGSVQAWVGTCTDITQRRQREEELRLSERNYRATFERAAIGLIRVGIDGQLLNVNHYICTLLGYSREELLQHTWRDLTHPDDFNQADEDYISQSIAGINSLYKREKRYLHKNGQQVWAQITVTPVFDATEHLQYFIAFVADISALKHAEEELAYLLAHEEAARSKAEEMNAQLKALQAITDSALSNMPLQDIQQAVLNRIQEIMAVDNIAVLLLSEDERYLTVSAVRGIEEPIAPYIHIPVGKGFAGRIVSERRPIIITDISQADVINPILRNETRSLMGVPLIIRERVIGVLHVGTRQERHFTSDDLHLLQRVGDRIAMTIESMRLNQIAQQAQEKAQERARLLETAFETITDGIVVFDTKGRYVQYNTAANNMLGLDLLPEDFYKLSLEERSRRFVVYDEFGQPLPSEKNPVARILQNEVLTTDNAQDLLLTLPDRADRYINVTGAPMRDQEGHITGVVCVFRDVTRRRQLERHTEMLGALIAMAETLVQTPIANDQANKSQIHSLLIHLVGQRIVELTQKILRCQRVGIVTIDPVSTRIHPIAVAGYTPEQEQYFFQSQSNTPFNALFRDPNVTSRLQAGEMLILDSQQVMQEELLALLGKQAMLVAPIRIGAQCIGLLCTAFDNYNHTYTEEEIELIGAMAKLSALAIERERHEAAHEKLLLILKEANTQLEQVNKLQNNFISIISHEFRTTLTGIQGFSELLRDEDFGPEEVKEYASDINADARRLTRMITELLDLERMKLGRLELNTEPINLNMILHEVVEHIRHIASRHNIRLLLTEDLPLVTGDYEKLTQVVTNLVTNAVKYSPGGGEILLTTRLEDTVVHLSVQDHGIGIPEEAHEQIFVQYNRIEADISRYITGTGLGLPIVRQLVELHGGHVWVESQPGEGSTFHITLPLTHEPFLHR